jgi:hypothetical protein
VPVSQAVRGAMLGSVDGVPVSQAVRGQWQPGGPLLLEVQGQSDLHLAENMANGLGRKMQSKGLVSDTTIADAVSDGLFALTALRNQYTTGASADTTPERICWRAIQQSMSRDTYGDTVPLADFTLEQLAASALPLPQLVGDDTRQDKAARLMFERTKARRPALLPSRIDALKAQGGRGKRMDTIDRIGRACLLMLQGESIGQAASLAGFTGSQGGARGAVRPEDRLAQAVRRLGIRYQLTLRQTGRDIARPV